MPASLGRPTPVHSLLALVGLAGPLAAQTSPQPTSGAEPAASTPAAVAQVAAVITAADITEHLTALGADSMRGPTPSAALERTARYVAAQFRASGLRIPGSADSTQLKPWFNWRADANGIQRYPIQGQSLVDYSRSTLQFYARPHRGDMAVVTEQGEPSRRRELSVRFATVARALSPVVANWAMQSLSDKLPATVVLAGPHTAASVRALDLHDRVALYVPPAQVDSAARQALVRELAARSAGVLVVGTPDSSAFAAQLPATHARPPRVADGYLPPPPEAWVVEVWPGVVEPVLELNGVRLAELRAAAAPLTRPLPFLQTNVDWAVTPRPDTVTAPNVMAMVLGSDLPSQHMYVLITAPAEDVTAVAGLLALAKAFNQPGAAPRRSLVFLVTSGGEEAWGRHYFIGRSRAPRLAVTLNLRGHLMADSLAVAGTREVDVPTPLAWTAALHPELGVTVVDTGSVVTPEHRAFTSQRTPVLAFRAGRDEASSAGPPDSSAVAAVQVLRLMVYNIYTLADAEAAPRWTSVGRQRLAAPVR